MIVEGRTTLIYILLSLEGHRCTLHKRPPSFTFLLHRKIQLGFPRQRSIVIAFPIGEIEDMLFVAQFSILILDKIAFVVAQVYQTICVLVLVFAIDGVER